MEVVCRTCMHHFGRLLIGSCWLLGHCLRPPLALIPPSVLPQPPLVSLPPYSLLIITGLPPLLLLALPPLAWLLHLLLLIYILRYFPSTSRTYKSSRDGATRLFTEMGAACGLSLRFF